MSFFLGVMSRSRKPSFETALGVSQDSPPQSVAA